MYIRQITSEETYTLAEAKSILESEQSRKREVFLCKVKRKLIGSIALLITIAEFTLAHFQMIDEGGAFIFMLPISIYLLFTKERMM